MQDWTRWFEDYWKLTSAEPWYTPEELEPLQLTSYEIDVATGMYKPVTKAAVSESTPQFGPGDVPVTGWLTKWPGYAEEVVNIGQQGDQGREEANIVSQEMVSIREQMQQLMQVIPPDDPNALQLLQETQAMQDNMMAEANTRLIAAMQAATRAVWQDAQLQGLVTEVPPEGLEYQPTAEDKAWLRQQTKQAVTAKASQIPNIKVPEVYLQPIVDAAQAEGIDPAALAAIISWESGFNPRASGDSGASYGLAQIHKPAGSGYDPLIHPEVTVQQAHDPDFAIPWAAYFYADLVRRFSDPNNVHPSYRGRDPYYLAAAGYGGPEHVKQGTVPAAQWRRAEYVLAALGADPSSVPTPPHIAAMSQTAGVPADWQAMTEQEIRAMYVQSQKRPVRLYSTMTTEEITKALKQPEFAGPTLPTNMTADDYIALYEKFAVTNADLIKDLGDRRAHMEQLVEQANEWEQAKQLAIQGIQTIPGPTFLDYVSRLMTSPAGVALNVLNTYFKVVSNPIAALAARHVPVLRPAFGDSWYEFEENYKALTEGKPWHEAFGAGGEAWEETESIPIFTRMFLEFTMDPMTWLSVPLGAAKQLPRVGKYLAAFEKGWLFASDIPLLPLKPFVALWKRIPPSPGQLAARTAKEFLVTIGDYVSLVGRRRGTGWTLGNIPAADLTNLLHEAVDHIVKNPTDMSIIGAVGRGLILRETPGRTVMNDWARRMGTVLPDSGPGSLSRQSFANITDDLDNMMGIGRVDLLDMDVVASRVMTSLGVQQTDANRLVMKQILDNYQKELVSGAKRVSFAKRTGDILHDIGDTFAQNYAGILRSEWYTHREATGSISAVVNWLDRGLRNNIGLWLDRILVMPIARLYLLNVAYGPFNLLETATRSWMAGGGFSAAPWRSKYKGVLNRMSIITSGHEARMPYAIMNAVPTLEALGALEKETIRDWTHRIGVTVAGREVKPIKAAAYLLNEIPAKWGLNQQADFMNNVIPKIMRRHDGLAPILDSIDTVMARHPLPRELADAVDPKLAKLIYHDASNAATAGLEPLQRLTQEGISPGSVDRARAEEAILKLDLISTDLKYGVLDTIESGRLWSLGDQGIKDIASAARNTIRTDYLRTPEFWNQRWQAWVADEMQRPILNQHDLVSRAVRLQESARTYEELLGNQIRYIQRETRGIRNMQARERAYSNMLSRLTGYMDDASTEMQKLATWIMSDIDMITDPVLKDKARGELDAITAKFLSSRQARIDTQAIHSTRRAATKAAQRNDAWYAETMDKVSQRWDRWQIERLNIERGSIVDMADIGREAIPMPDRTGTDLSIDDVATLFGGHPNDLQRNIFHTELMTMTGRDMFAATAIARTNSTVRVTNPGRTADALGWTEEKLAKVWDDIIAGMGYDLEDISALSPHFAQIDSMEASLSAIYHTSGLPDDAIPAMQRWAGEVTDDLRQIPGYDTDAYHAMRGDVIDEAVDLYYQTFTDYDHGNIADAVLKRIFPFWNYEFQRYWWLVRTAKQYPVSAIAWGRYMTRTNYGYIPIGGWDIHAGPAYVHIPEISFEVNPTRGTVGAGGFRALVMPDYPEYFDAFPWLSEPMGMGQRYGFYPGILATLPLALFGSKVGKPQFGDLLPAIASTPLNIFTAAFPASAPAKAIRELLFPSHFRDYKVSLRASQLGMVGEALFQKKLTGVPLTDDEQQVWDDASGSVSLMDIMMEQLAIFRLRPHELNQLNEQNTQLIAEVSGISPAMQEQYKMQGISVFEKVAMPPKYRDMVRQLEYYQNFARWTTPLLPSELQQELAIHNEYWDEYRNGRERIMTEGLTDPEGRKRYLSISELTQEFTAGRISGKEWTTMQGELLSAFHNHMLQMQLSERYKHLPFTDDARLQFYQDMGRVPPPVHPLQEMLNMYYGIMPELLQDPETGAWEYDFQTYYAKIRMWDDAVPEQYRDEIDAQLSKYRNPLQVFHRQTILDYFRSYTEVRQFLMDTLPETDKQVAVKYYASTSLDERETLKQQVGSNGLQIISSLETDVQNARTNMRMANPTLDARLLFFGRTQRVLTPMADTIYRQLCQTYGKPP